MATKTIEDLKQELIDCLAKIDKSKLNMADLNCYAYIVKTVDDMVKVDASAQLMAESMKMLSSMRENSFEFGEKKEGAING